MPKILRLAAVGEIATGFALLAVPSLVGRLLLGEELSGVSIIIGRVAGIALISLGVACLPNRTPLAGMMTYSTLATIYLASIGFEGEFTGRLLWPALGLHAILTILLARAAIAGKVTQS